MYYTFNQLTNDLRKTIPDNLDELLEQLLKGGNFGLGSVIFYAEDTYEDDNLRLAMLRAMQFLFESQPQTRVKIIASLVHLLHDSSLVVSEEAESVLETVLGD
jgi:hypothetical protein